jgi:hypothetical protein
MTLRSAHNLRPLSDLNDFRAQTSRVPRLYHNTLNPVLYENAVSYLIYATFLHIAHSAVPLKLPQVLSYYLQYRTDSKHVRTYLYPLVLPHEEEQYE